MKLRCTNCNSDNIKLRARSTYCPEKLDKMAFASRKLPEYMHFTVYECRNCRMLFMTDCIEQEVLADLYKEAEYDSKKEAECASRTYMYYLDKYKNLPKIVGGGIMDIGTGDGSFLSLLQKAGYKNIVGIEPSRAPVSYADDKIKDCIINDIFRVGQFEAGSFEMITCFQTMEHMAQPAVIVKEIHRILGDGGVFFAVCHNYRSLVNRIMGFKSPIFDIEHLQLYSPKSISSLLEKSGFNEIKTKSICNRYPLKYWVKLFPLPGKIKSKVLRFLETCRAGNLIIPVNVGNICVWGKK